jgi:hypothetical protein
MASGTVDAAIGVLARVKLKVRDSACRNAPAALAPSVRLSKARLQSGSEAALKHCLHS